MFSYVWPIALAVVSNIFYQICAKSTPEGMDPLASLTVTYTVGAAAAGALYFILNREGNLLRAGWPVSTAAIVQAAFLAVALLFVGLLLYHEPITRSKAAGVVICMVGLYFINQ